MGKYIMKRCGNILVPDPLQADDFNKFVKKDAFVTCEIKHQRNVKFHRKFFAMIGLGYEHWNPSNEQAAQLMGIKVLKSFDVFRDDVTISAGYYVATFGLGGEVKLVAKSISFAGMEEPEFNELYYACIQVLLDLVFANKTSVEDIDNQVNSLLSF